MNAKILRGTFRPGRETPGVGSLPVCPLPPPPRRLSAAERRAWLELAPVVDAAGTATEVDVPAFRLLAEALAYSRQDLAPSARVRALQLVSSLLGSFGLSPSTRGKVPAAPKPPTRSPVDEFTRKP
jgi:hypothetical protein